MASNSGESFVSKLNPFAREFVLPDENNHRMLSNRSQRRSVNNRASSSQHDERIKRTVYVANVGQQVFECELAALFSTCGLVIDCRICGNPNSVLRIAFIEFADEDGAKAALTLTGTVLRFFALNVLPSRTAIYPINPDHLPKTGVELEMCTRTICCTNIDKRVTQTTFRDFLESMCGEVHCMRILRNYNNSSRVAFVEFVMAESAIVALNLSGVVLGSLAIRISPSKSPVRHMARMRG